MNCNLECNVHKNGCHVIHPLDYYHELVVQACEVLLLETWKLCTNNLLPALKLPELVVNFSMQQVSVSLLPLDCSKIQMQKTMIPYFDRSRQVPDSESGFEILLALAAGFPVDAQGEPSLFDVIGSFTDGELVEKVNVKFIAVSFDSAKILSSFLQWRISNVPGNQGRQ